MKISRTKLSADMPTSAMGDIVFNLLIFLVTLANPQSTEPLPVELAQSPDLKTHQAAARVTIDVEGQLYFNGIKTNLDRLPGQLQSALVSEDPEQRKIMLSVHKSITAPQFEPVIQAIAEGGGNLVHVLDLVRTP